MTWTGWDGSVWDLLSGAGGVQLVDSGIRGMAMPPVQRYTSTSPAVAGSRWKGSNTSEREVFWPILVDSQVSSSDWLATDRAFWRTMDPDRLGTWSVTAVDGNVRTLRARFTSDGDHAFEVDPSGAGWALYGITLVAELPYWKGAEIVRSWMASAAVPFFGGVIGGSGPPFFISSGSTLGTATLDNPGDVRAFPIWSLTGPLTSAALGVAGHVVNVPFALAAGQSLTIDTRPDAMTAITETGLDRTADLGSSDFAAVEAGQSVPLSLTLAGTGTVSVSLIPRYWRAW